MLSFSIILLLYSKYTLTSSFSNGAFDPSDITTTVNDHNDMRRQVAQGSYNPAGDPDYTFPTATDMIQLEWDATLATAAKNYAQGCTWAHSSNGYGENLAARTGTTMTTANLQIMIDGWLDDEAAATSFTGAGVNYGNLVCDTSRPTVGSCGHFTQGIWAQTANIGCGYKNCSTGSPFDTTKYGVNWLYLVCNYSPGGNVANANVYTAGTSSCTTASCPTGYKNCVNHLCASSTLSPTAATPAPVTPAPISGCTPASVKLCDFGYTGSWMAGFNGEWQCKGIDTNNKPYYERTVTGSSNPNPHKMETTAWNWYVIKDANGGGWYGYCDQGTITSCGASNWKYPASGAWVSDDALITTGSCPATAQSNPEAPISIPLQPQEEPSNNVNSYPLNMTEMHIILGILVLVLITVCGMIFGFCYYVKKNNKKEKQIVNAQENEMVYFESANMDEQNTPTNENVNDSNKNQPSLKINVNGTATMVTKLPTTTPVTPLINLDQNYE